jgi:3-methylfumaryl-CoA hydratase
MTGQSAGDSQTRSETVNLTLVRRVAAMLDLDPADLTPGKPLPRGWHFALIGGETPRRDLRSDGFPGLGAAMPQLGKPRLLLGARSMTFQGDVAIGATIQRRSALASVVEKTGRSGPLAIVKVEHSLTLPGAAAPTVAENQTYYLAGPAPADAPPAARPSPAVLPPGGRSRQVTPDDLLLFQYSALGFNTHRIHFDRDYARQVEGHPDLVVNGGLATLLATEFLRSDLRLQPQTLSARHLAPLYVNRPMTIHVLIQADGTGQILLLDCDGIVAAELAVTCEKL